MSIIIFIVNENQIENINAQNDEKNNENIVIINKDKSKSYNIVKSKNQKDKRKEIIITNIIENDKINITVKNDTKLLRTMIGRLFA